jgi:hypothetical protein
MGREPRRKERFRELFAWYMLQGVNEATARRRAQDKLITIPTKVNAAGLAQSAAVLRVGQYSVRNRDQLKDHHIDIVVCHRRFEGKRQRMEVMGNASYARWYRDIPSKYNGQRAC